MGRTTAIAIGVVVVFISISAAATTDAILPAAGDRTNVDARDQHRALFIGWKEPEGNDGSGVATEDDKDADAEAGEYTRDFLEVALSRLWERRFGRITTTAKTMDISRGNKHEEEVVSWLMFETICGHRRRWPTPEDKAHPACVVGMVQAWVGHFVTPITPS